MASPVIGLLENKVLHKTLNPLHFGQALPDASAKLNDANTPATPATPATPLLTQHATQPKAKKQGESLETRGTSSHWLNSAGFVLIGGSSILGAPLMIAKNIEDKQPTTVLMFLARLAMGPVIMINHSMLVKFIDRFIGCWAGLGNDNVSSNKTKRQEMANGNVHGDIRECDSIQKIFKTNHTDELKTVRDALAYVQGIHGINGEHLTKSVAYLWNDLSYGTKVSLEIFPEFFMLPIKYTEHTYKWLKGFDYDKISQDIKAGRFGKPVSISLPQGASGKEAMAETSYFSHLLENNDYKIPLPKFMEDHRHLELSQFGSVAPMMFSTVQTIGTAIHNPLLEQVGLWTDGLAAALSEYSHVMQAKQLGETANNLEKGAFPIADALAKEEAQRLAKLNALIKNVAPEQLQTWIKGYRLDHKLMDVGAALAGLGGLLWFTDFGRGAFTVGRGFHTRYNWELDTHGDFVRWQKHQHVAPKGK
ncbi:MAG: hypothetical protein ACKO37_05940 [Vampirovibrionales bacterium]